jgi:hypothetical protein
LSTGNGVDVMPLLICWRHLLVSHESKRSALRTARRRPSSTTNMEASLRA